MIQCKLSEVRNDTVLLTRGGNPARYKRVDDALMGVVLENQRTGKRITLDKDKLVWRSLRLHEELVDDNEDVPEVFKLDNAAQAAKQTRYQRLIDILDLDDVETEIII